MGRDAELDRVHELLQQESAVAVCAVAGMGGIGKTELAFQYALKHRDSGTYPGGVCWLRARQEVKTQIVEFARSCLGLTPPEDYEIDAKVRWCWQHWREGEEVLIVFDDVQDYQDIETSLPPSRSRFKVLLTTRLHLGSSFQPLDLKVLSPDAALELLRSIVDKNRIDQQIESAKQLCEWLGYLPLGLELVGRYLQRKPDISLATLQSRLEEKSLAAKALAKTEVGMTAKLGVAAAFELSWQELTESAQQLAMVLSLFATAPIRWQLVQACLSEEDEEDLEDWRDEQLLGLHLLQQLKKEVGVYQLHPLVREFFACKREQWVAADGMKVAFCQLMVKEAQRIPQTPTLTVIEAVTPVIPHLKETATALNEWLSDKDLLLL